MFIRKVTIQNIQSIDTLAWRAGPDCVEGWHVILGDNGSGKSSFLRSIALALIGAEEAAAARQDWHSWLRRDTDQGHVSVEVVPDPQYDFIAENKKKKEVTVEISLKRVKPKLPSAPRRRGIVQIASHGSQFVPPDIFGQTGWFSASYGPFRRLSGGDKEAERIFTSNPKLAAHISLFSEGFALTEVVSWLQDLQYKSLEDRLEQKTLLEMITDFVNQAVFLPHGVKLEKISSEGVFFKDVNGFRVAFEDLSDGYRSILSMTFELLRQLTRSFPPDQLFDKSNKKIVAPGVVLIDEIDAHLHPTWQKKIGFSLTKYFPRVQFIVTTHSPLICQASVHGSIFRLPVPGNRESGYMLEGTERDRLIFGDILDAYSTEVFGSGDTRSELSHDKQQQLALLNVKQITSGLTKKEKEEQERLRAVFHTSPNILQE